VTDTDFGMSFLSKEEFFESADEAVSFLREKMDEAV